VTVVTVSAAALLEPQAALRKHRAEVASEALRAIARAFGFDGNEQQLLAVFGVLTKSWADTHRYRLPWSGLGADASPCDVSVVLGGPRREIRVTVEAQGDPPSPQSYWNAAMRLSETLEACYGADLSLLRAVEDVFRPLAPDAVGVLWHGAVFEKGKTPWFKVYLHLMCLGRPAARETARAALGSLGLANVWPAVASRLLPDDELLFLSFDLVAAAESRVKLYVRHAEATPASLGRACRLQDADHAGDVRYFAAELFGGDDRTVRRGALTSLYLRHGHDMPVHASTHIRLYPHCAESDADLASRLQRVLRYFDIPPEPYQAMIAALASRPLSQEKGIHGWASIQWTGRRPTVTVYLSPRLHFDQYGPISLEPERMWPSPVCSTSG
jgi:hypothetical protein